MYFNTKQLRHSDTKLLQNQCELRHTQLVTILMLVTQNTRLAGYMLTGNKFIFLDTNGSVAWLYHSPKFLSPLGVLDKFYDRIPILFERTTKFVNPITRQTYDFASVIRCLVITLMCFNLICRMTIPGINFYLIPCILMILCRSSQLNLDMLLSFLLSTLGVLECILPSK